MLLRLNLDWQVCVGERKQPKCLANSQVFLAQLSLLTLQNEMF